ncbi:MAG: hypothetical protein FK730_08795 [Asgard group archaeon]|nr:hypothetical protein [Asgard group archaeon]
MNLIKERMSRRDYLPTVIEKSKLKEIQKIINKPLVGPFGGKSHFHLIDTKNVNPDYKIRVGTYGLVSGARYYLICVTKKSKYNTIDSGYTFEKLILKATDLNLGTVWLGMKISSKNFVNIIPLSEDEFIPAVSPIGYTKERLTIKESLIFWGINARKRKPWKKIFFKENFNQPIMINEVENYAIPLEMVRLAPSGKNIQPWRILANNNFTKFHFYIENNSKVIDQQISKFKLLDIGIAMSHFDLTAKELKLNGKWIKEDPKLNEMSRNLFYIASWQTK